MTTREQFEDEAEELVVLEMGEINPDGAGNNTSGKKKKKKKRKRTNNNNVNGAASSILGATATTTKRYGPQSIPRIACITLLIAVAFVILSPLFLGGEEEQSNDSSHYDDLDGLVMNETVPEVEVEAHAVGEQGGGTGEQVEIVEGLPPVEIPEDNPPVEIAKENPPGGQDASSSPPHPPVGQDENPPPTGGQDASASSPPHPPGDGQAASSSPPQAPATILGGDGGYQNHHQAIATKQIENFKNGQGLLLNFIITHHGGTTVRREFGDALKCPSFVCMAPLPEDGVGPGYPKLVPWSHNDTTKNIDIVRQHFQFIMWQFAAPPFGEPQIADTDWENPNLVSMLVIREPISRSMAGDGVISQKYPTIINNDKTITATLDEWWAFAHEETHNNNYALRVLSSYDCCDGANTSQVYLDQAKELVKRFTFVLDINCLEHGLDMVADILGFQAAHFFTSEDNVHDHTPAKDKIPYPEVYDYLVQKNKLDIELYEFAKTLALLDCDMVYAAEAAAAQDKETLEQAKEEEEEKEMEQAAQAQEQQGVAVPPAAAAAEEKTPEGAGTPP